MLYTYDSNWRSDREMYIDITLIGYVMYDADDNLLPLDANRGHWNRRSYTIQSFPRFLPKIAIIKKEGNYITGIVYI